MNKEKHSAVVVVFEIAYVLYC